MPKRNPQHARLLEDREVKRWYSNVARGSPVTASVYLRRIGAFCQTTGKKVHEVPALKEKELHGLLLDYVSSEEEKGRAGSYIKSTVNAVKSWLGHNGVRLTRPVKIRGAEQTPTLQDERVPSQDELRRIILSATPRDRVSCVLMAHSGVRPEVLGNFNGTDGLTVSDLPDMKVKGGKVEFECIPALVVVRAEASKAGHKYFTFLSEEGCEYLKAHLEERIASGARLTLESDIISPKSAHKSFVTTINVSDGIRNAIRAAGFKWRPYVLRAYFDTQLLLAESKGKVAHDYRVFWMGHTGSMEARYTTNKGRLPKVMVDDMREAYKRCESFLSTIPARSQQDIEAHSMRTMLIGIGYTEDELKDVDFESLTREEFREMVKQKFFADAAQRPAQQVVDVEKVPEFLAQRWTVVTSLGDNKVVINPPGL